jgi:hypothetical protein
MTGRAVRRAFDAVQGEPPVPAGPRPVAVRPGRRAMPVRAALEWAFGAECARLHFEDGGGWTVGQDCVLRLMRRKALGCAVDGGGRSRSHPDADAIAACVADLPEALGGRAMALRVAELARAGLAPDGMAGAVQRCVPKGWAHGNRFGPRGKTEVVEVVKVWHKGRFADVEARWCLLDWTPSAAQIAAGRRDYQTWRLALLDIWGRLPTYGGLEAIEVTAVLPPPLPPLPGPRMGLVVPAPTPWATRGLTSQGIEG